MAEYRGLTIRIGADTSKFASALKATKGAISDTQKALRTLKQAMNLDPDNKSLGRQYIGELQAQAVNATAKMRLLQTQMEEVGKTASAVKDKTTIAELAEDTANAALNARRAKERYVDLTEALAQAYTQISNLDAAQQLGIKFDHNHNDLSEIQAVLELSGATQEQVEETISTIIKLKDAFTDAAAAAQDADFVEQFHKNQVECARLEAQVKSVAREMVAMSRSDIADGIDEAREKFDLISADADRAKAKFEALDKALELDPKNVDVVSKRSEALQEALARGREKADALRAVLQKYKDAGLETVVRHVSNISERTERARKAFEDANAQVARLKGYISDAESQMNKLSDEGQEGSDTYRKLADNVERWNEELKEAEETVERTGKKYHTLAEAGRMLDTQTELQTVENANTAMVNSGKTARKEMTTTALLVLEKIGEMSRRVVQEISTNTYALQEAYTNMRKTVDATDEEYQTLYDSAVKASLVQPVSADQILNVEALGGQLGFVASELDEFQRVANGLDISTNMDWSQAATNMAQFFNIMDLHHDEVDRYGSSIVELGNNFATTESDISDMALRISGAGKSMGLSAADVLGLSAALSSLGVTAEAGGSSVSQIMAKIDRAVAEGGDTLEKWARVYGSDTAEEFANAWQSTPIEAFEQVFTRINELAVKGDENLTLLLDDINISTIRQLDLARRLANNPHLLTEAVNASNAAWEENTALTTEVERRNQALSGRIDVLRNSFTAMSTELGEGLKPIVDGLISGMTFVVGVLDKIPDPAKTAAVGIMGLMAAGASIIPVYNFATTQWDDFTKSLAKKGSTIVGAAKNVGSLGGALVNFVTSGHLAVAAGGAIMAYLVYSMVKAKLAADAHNKSIAEFRSELGKLGESSREVSVKVNSLKDSYGGLAASGMSVEDLTEKLRTYNEAQTENETQARLTVSNLENYKSVLDELVPQVQGLDDASQMSAEAQSKLQWALDGLNEALGTNYTLEDLLRGTYEDEEGNISSLITHIDELIAKRQEEARMKAEQTRLDNAYQLEQEMLQNLIDANNAYNEAQQKVVDKAAELQQKLGYDQATAMEEAQRVVLGSKDGLEEYAEAVDLAAEAYKGAMGEVDEATNHMANAQALENLGSSVEEVSQKLMDMGVYADLLSTTTPADFAAIAEECNGDIDLMIQKLMELNGVEPKVEVEVEDEGAYEKIVNTRENAESIDGIVATATLNVEDHATENAEIASAVVSSFGELNPNAPHLSVYNTPALEGVATARKEVEDYDAIDVKEKQLEADETDAVDAADNATGAIEGVPTSWSTTFYADVSPAVQAMNWLSDKIGGFVSSASATISAKFGGHAEGGLLYHADGFIANRPTFITSRDVVGEAGAEAVIPLTNRKYVQPFADTVADGILSKMDGGTHVTVNLNYSAGEDANQLARDLARAISMHKATRGRW